MKVARSGLVSSWYCQCCSNKLCRRRVCAASGGASAEKAACAVIAISSRAARSARAGVGENVAISRVLGWWGRPLLPTRRRYCATPRAIRYKTARCAGLRLVPMWIGTSFALAAGLMWGLVFVAPLMLADYPAALLSFARYLAFGLIALPLAWFDRGRLAQLTRGDWIEALKLSTVGNLLYYLCLAAAIQRAGGPLPTMIIGTLPVVIAISSNLRDARRDGRLRWGQLAPSLLLIAAGIAMVNHVELAKLGADTQADRGRYALGALLAVGALACWTWYPIRNADWLRAHPDRSPRTWATAQGLATLPMALAGT